MAKDTLIRCTFGGKKVKMVQYQALMAQFFDRLEKMHGTGDVQDPELETKLSKVELSALYTKYPHLDSNRELPPEPKPLNPAKFRELISEEPVKTEVSEPESKTEVEEVAPETEAESTEETELSEDEKLRAILDEAGVKHGRVKHLDKLKEMVANLENK